MLELHATVRGQVQGVWFRAWTRDMAREVGVSGWVRNLPDGSVETVAQGSTEQLDRFEQRLWDGPPLARVTVVDARRREADPVLADFAVRR